MSDTFERSACEFRLEALQLAVGFLTSDNATHSGEPIGLATEFYKFIRGEE